MTELLRRIDVALDALVDVERETEDLDVAAWVSQSRLALLGAADAARRAEREDLLEQLELELQTRRDAEKKRKKQSRRELDQRRIEGVARTQPDPPRRAV